MSEKEGRSGWLELMQFLFLHTYCIYIVLQAKKKFLKIKVLLLLVKMIFQAGKDSQFFPFLLSIIVHPSAALLSQHNLQTRSTVLVMQKAERWKVIQTAHYKLTIPSISIDWRDLHYELNQCKKTMVNSSKNKEIDHFNKRKGTTTTMYPFLLGWNSPWRNRYKLIWKYCFHCIKEIQWNGMLILYLR